MVGIMFNGEKVWAREGDTNFFMDKGLGGEIVHHAHGDICRGLLHALPFLGLADQYTLTAAPRVDDNGEQDGYHCITATAKDGSTIYAIRGRDDIWIGYPI